MKRSLTESSAPVSALLSPQSLKLLLQLPLNLLLQLPSKLPLQLPVLQAVMPLLALSAILALPTVHAQPGLGRLFNTPQERQAIDTARSRPATAGPASRQGAPGMAAGVETGMEPNMAPGMGADTAPGMAPSQSAAQAAGQATRPGFAPDIVPDLPPNVPPGMQAEMMAAARAARDAAPAPGMAQQQQQQQQQQQGQQPSPMPGSAAAADTAPPPEQLTMNGVLRSSNGRSTVWLNNQPQRGAANKFVNRDSKAITVTLPSGKRIVLQPGQRYDLADGRVKDVGQ